VEEQNEISLPNLIVQRPINNLPALFVLLKMLFSLGFYRELVRMLFKHKANKQAFFAFLLTSYARVAYTAKVLRTLSGFAIHKYSKITLYSYWLSHYANVACVVKMKLKNKDGAVIHAVSRAHGSYDVYLPNNTNNYRPYKKELATILDYVFPISSAGVQALIKEKFPNSKVSLARLGVAPGSYCVNYNNKDPLIVSCSALNSIKRIDLLIRALALVAKPGLRWIHIGDGPLRKDLELLAAKKLTGKVAYEFRGFVSNDKIQSMYIEINPQVFINVSSIEGLPVSIMEACSCGIPVIATNVGGTREICIDQNNGFLLPADPTPEVVAKALGIILSQPEQEWRTMSGNSRAIFNEQFNATKNYVCFAELLAKI
jgi:glycosyltransferase involved in cell wall biosynthesis